MTKEDIYDSTIGRLMCICGNHDKITYYPRGDARTADVEVTMCRRCVKELNRRRLKNR